MPWSSEPILAPLKAGKLALEQSWPAPPTSNVWAVLSWSPQNAPCGVYVRQSLTTGTWQFATNTTANEVRFLIDKTIPSLFFNVVANPEAVQKVTLAWLPSSDPNVIGYRIYYGAGSHNYTNMLDVGPALEADVYGLVSGQKYYFAATAYNILSLESDFSNELMYQVPKLPWPVPVSIAQFPLPPNVVSLTATNVQDTAATVRGQLIDDGGAPTLGVFLYGPDDPSVDTNADWSSLANAGVVSSNAVSLTLTNLSPGTKYFYIFGGINAAGADQGWPVQYFTTPALP